MTGEVETLKIGHVREKIAKFDGLDGNNRLQYPQGKLLVCNHRLNDKTKLIDYVNQLRKDANSYDKIIAGEADELRKTTKPLSLIAKKDEQSHTLGNSIIVAKAFSSTPDLTVKDFSGESTKGVLLKKLNAKKCTTRERHNSDSLIDLSVTSTLSGDIYGKDTNTSKKGTQKLTLKKDKRTARRKTDPYNDFQERIKGLQQSIQRTISDPGKGNLPSFELLGVEQNVQSFTSTTVTNNNEVKLNGEIHNVNNTDNFETCMKSDIIENIQVISSDVEPLNANKADVLGYNLLTTADDEVSSAEQADAPDDQISEEKEVDSPSCDTIDLVTEVVYTHDDVDFLNSIEHEDLFEEPTEILYATRVDINTLTGVDVSDQNNCIISDLTNDCSTKTIENDDELCEVVEELRKGTDFRNTKTDTQTPSCSTSPDSPSTESHDNDQYFSLNFAEDTDECIAEASDEELEINLDTFESDLQEAMEESVKSKSITPIIKKELQFKIQCKRLEMGEDELEVEFSQPKKYQLTEDEIRKVNARREQNRRSAKKGRVKAKQKERHLTQILNKASSSIAKLKREVFELRSIKTDLLQRLKNHFQECQLFTLIEQQKKFLSSSGF